MAGSSSARSPSVAAEPAPTRVTKFLKAILRKPYRIQNAVAALSDSLAHYAEIVKVIRARLRHERKIAALASALPVELGHLCTLMSHKQ